MINTEFSPEEERLIDEYVEQGVYDSRESVLRAGLCTLYHNRPPETQQERVLSATTLDRYLLARVEESPHEVVYVDSGDIALPFGVSPQQVARQVQLHRERSFPRKVTIERWGGKKTKWEVRLVE